METNLKQVPYAIALAGALGVTAISSAHAYMMVTLPDPSSFLDGIPIQQNDLGNVYSASLLAQVQAKGYLPGNYSNFLPAQGTGQLGVLIYSSNAVKNVSPFQSQMDSLNSGDFSGIWGIGYNGTVGALRSILSSTGYNYQPMFIFDHNENHSNLLVNGEFSIFKAGTTTYNSTQALGAWSIDGNSNGVYDPDSPILSCDSVAIGPDASTATPEPTCAITMETVSGTTYEWATNGSGKPDYLVTFDGLDIFSETYSDNDQIVGRFVLKGNVSGFEELSIGGYRYGDTSIPEPSSLALLGLALASLGFMRYRKT